MPAASPVGNLTDFLIFHLQHGNDFALSLTHTNTHSPLCCLSKCPSKGLTLLPWANSYLIQKQGSLCPAASGASDFRHHSLTSNQSTWTLSRLPDNECTQQNGPSNILLNSKSLQSISPPLTA